MQKFIHDNEQYVLEAKRKHGKTRIDRELNEYLRKKKNNINLYNNNGNNNNNMNNNFNLQPLLMNYLLLQNQLLLQQRNPNIANAINSLIQPNSDEINNENGNQANNDECENGEKNMDYTHLNRDGVEKKNEENLENKEEKNEVQNANEEKDVNANDNNKEIIKKILEVINEKNNNIEQRQTDPRKKGK